MRGEVWGRWGGVGWGGGGKGCEECGRGRGGGLGGSGCGEGWGWGVFCLFFALALCVVSCVAPAAGGGGGICAPVYVCLSGTAWLLCWGQRIGHMVSGIVGGCGSFACRGFLVPVGVLGCQSLSRPLGGVSYLFLASGVEYLGFFCLGFARFCVLCFFRDVLGGGCFALARARFGLGLLVFLCAQGGGGGREGESVWDGCVGGEWRRVGYWGHSCCFVLALGGFLSGGRVTYFRCFFSCRQGLFWAPGPAPCLGRVFGAFGAGSVRHSLFSMREPLLLFLGGMGCFRLRVARLAPLVGRETATPSRRLWRYPRAYQLTLLPMCEVGAGPVDHVFRVGPLREFRVLPGCGFPKWFWAFLFFGCFGGELFPAGGRLRPLLV